jgi:hypothetical protein
VRGNPHALFGKRPTERTRTTGTSPAADFTREGVVGKRTSNAGTSLDGLPRGMRNLPFHDLAQNRIWLALAALAADLLAWTARLALPALAATYEPKRLRLRILAVAGRIVRTARRRVLHIDPAWPWADVITTAHQRLCALPAP